MKKLAHQKIATLCAVIGTSISWMGGALAEDGSSSAGGVADAASEFAPMPQGSVSRLPKQSEAMLSRLKKITVSQSTKQPVKPPVPTAAVRDAGSAQKQTAKWLTAVSDTNLEQMRGGFDAGSGLLVSFGIQRAVYINGNMVTTTSFTLPDVGKVTDAQAEMLRTTAGTVNLVQNGQGNTIQSGALSQTIGATVIQNTLNNQNIQNLTIIDATTNSLSMLKNINALSTLNDALSKAVGNI